MKPILSILLLVVLPLAACDPLSPKRSSTYEQDEKWRGPQPVERTYRFTVTLNTPDGVVSESGIMNARIQTITHRDGQRRLPRLTMEAIPIRLKDGRILFMLTNAHRHSWSLNAPWVTDQAGLEKGFDVPANPETYPRFAIFDDMRDPLSFQPFEYEEISKFIGNGYSLKDINISRSNEKPLKRINNILPWLVKTRRTSFDKRFCKQDINRYLICVSCMDFDRINV